MESLDASPPNRLVDAHVLVALSDADRSTDAIELSAASGVSLDRARREGNQSYIARLSPDELLRLEAATWEAASGPS